MFYIFSIQPTCWAQFLPDLHLFNPTETRNTTLVYPKAESAQCASIPKSHLFVSRDYFKLKLVTPMSKNKSDL